MTELKWLSASDGPEDLPDPAEALAEPNGLLAAGAGSVQATPGERRDTDRIEPLLR